MSNDEIIDLLMFHVNDKAKEASSLMNETQDESKGTFYYGQYKAFNEVYSMLTNIKRTIV